MGSLAALQALRRPEWTAGSVNLVGETLRNPLQLFQEVHQLAAQDIDLEIRPVAAQLQVLLPSSCEIFGDDGCGDAVKFPESVVMFVLGDCNEKIPDLLAGGWLVRSACCDKHNHSCDSCCRNRRSKRWAAA